MNQDGDLESNPIESGDPGEASRGRIAAVRFRQALYKLVMFGAMVAIFVVLVGMIRDRWNAQAAPDFLGELQRAHPLPARVPEFDPAHFVLPPIVPQDATPDIQLSSEAGAQVNDAEPPKLEAQATIDEARLLLGIGVMQMRLAEASLNPAERRVFRKSARELLERAANYFDGAAEANRSSHPAEAEKLELRASEADEYKYRCDEPFQLNLLPPKPVAPQEFIPPIS